MGPSGDHATAQRGIAPAGEHRRPARAGPGQAPHTTAEAAGGPGAPARGFCHFAGSGGVGAAPALGLCALQEAKQQVWEAVACQPESQALGLGEGTRREESGAEARWSARSLGCAGAHAHAVCWKGPGTATTTA